MGTSKRIDGADDPFAGLNKKKSTVSKNGTTGTSQSSSKSQLQSGNPFAGLESDSDNAIPAPAAQNTQPDREVQPKTVKPLFGDFSAPSINVAGKKVPLKTQIPLANSKNYADELQLRIDTKTFTGDDVETVSRSMGASPLATNAYLSGRVATGTVIDFNDKKSKAKTDLENAVIDFNNNFTDKDYVPKEGEFIIPGSRNKPFLPFDVNAVLSNADVASEFLSKYKQAIDLMDDGKRGPGAVYAKGDGKAQAEKTKENYKKVVDAFGKYSGVIAGKIMDDIMENPALTKAQKVHEIAKRVDGVNYKNNQAAVESRLNPFNYLLHWGGDTKGEIDILNSTLANVELGVNRKIKEQINYNGALKGAIIEDFNDKVAQLKTDEEKQALYNTVEKEISGIDLTIKNLESSYEDEKSLQKKFPVLFRQELTRKLNDFQALRSGNVEGEENNEYKNLSVFDFLKNNGYDINDQKVRDVLGSGTFKDYSFWGRPLQNISDVFVNSAKSVLDWTPFRDKADILSEKIQAELFPTQVGEKDEYQLNWKAKTAQNIMNTTGQVIGQGILQVATAGAGRMAGLSRLASANAAFWTSGTLTSYDQAYKDSYDFLDNSAARLTYAGLIALSNAASEKLFPDMKIVVPGVSDMLSDLASKIGGGDFSQALVNDVFGKVKSAYLSYAKNFGKNVSQETAEEVATSLFESATRYIYGDPNANWDKAMDDAKNTAIQTVTGMPVIAAMGAYKDVRRERNTSARSTIYNAALYHDEALDAIKKGFDEKLYDKDEMNSKISVLNTAKSALDITEKTLKAAETTLTRPQKELYVANLTAEALLKKQLSDLGTDGVVDNLLKSKLEEKISNLQSQRQQLLSGEVNIDDNGDIIPPAIYSIDGKSVNEKGQPITKDEFLKVMNSPNADDFDLSVEGDSEISDLLEKLGGVSEEIKPGKPQRKLSDEALAEKNRKEDNDDIDKKLSGLNPNDATYEVQKENLEKQRTEINDYYDNYISSLKTNADGKDKEAQKTKGQNVLNPKAGADGESAPVIQSAVIEIGGKQYEGNNHAEAILKAKEAGEDISNVDRQAEGKFKLSDGTIIDRATAKEQFGQDRAELLIPQNEAANQANKDYAKIITGQGNAETTTTVLTKEAEDLLASVGEGSMPTFITKNLEKIAADNGVVITDKMTAVDVINALKEQPIEASTKPTVTTKETTPNIEDWSKDVESTAKALDADKIKQIEEITGIDADPSMFNEGTTPEQYVASMYHLSKADGSNPELVKAVEDLLSDKSNPKVTEIESKKADIEKLEKEKQEALQPLIEEKERLEKEIAEIEKDTKGSLQESDRISSVKKEIANLRNENGEIPANKMGEFNKLSKLLRFLQLSPSLQIERAIQDFIDKNNLTDKQGRYIRSLSKIRDSFSEIVQELQDLTSVEFVKSDLMDIVDSNNTSIEKIINDSQDEINETKNKASNIAAKELGIEIEKEYSADELDNFVQKHGSNQTKFIWNLIKNIAQKLGVKTRFSLEGKTTVPNGYAGHYAQGKIDNRATLLQTPDVAARVIVHELVHGVTNYIIDAVKKNRTDVLSLLTQKQINAAKKLSALLKQLQSDSNTKDFYGAKNEDEILAELTHDGFVEALKNKKLNFVEKILDYILDILGVSTNAYEEALGILKDMLENPIDYIDKGFVQSNSLYSQSNTKLDQLKQQLAEVNKKIDEVTKRFDAQIAQKQSELKALEEQSTSAKKADIERRRQEELLGKSFTKTTEKVVTGKGQSAGKTIVRFTESKVSSDGEVLTIKPKAKFKNEDTGLSTTPETITVKEFKEHFYENLSEQDKEMFDEFFTDDSTKIKLVEARIGLKGKFKGQVNIDVESLEGQPFGFELQNGKEINAKYDAELDALKEKQISNEAKANTTVSDVSSGVKPNWDYEGEGDALSGKDGQLAYTQRLLPDWNRESQKGNINPDSKVTYDIVRGRFGGQDNKDVVEAKDENGVTVGLIKLSSNGGIEHLVVAPEFRKKGIATELYNRLKNENPSVDISKTKQRTKDFAAWANKLKSETKSDIEKRRQEEIGKIENPSRIANQIKIEAINAKYDAELSAIENVKSDVGDTTTGDGFEYVRNKFSQQGYGGKRISDKESNILNKEVDKLIERAEKENGVKRNKLKQATWETSDGYKVVEFFENGRGGTRIITPKGEEINLFDNKYKSESGRDISYFPKAHEPFKSIGKSKPQPTNEAKANDNLAKEVLATMAGLPDEMSDSEKVIDYAIDKAVENPSLFKKEYLELFDKIKDRIPTNKIEESLEYHLDKMSDSPNVKILDDMLLERQPERNEPSQDELDNIDSEVISNKKELPSLNNLLEVAKNKNAALSAVSQINSQTLADLLDSVPESDQDEMIKAFEPHIKDGVIDSESLGDDIEALGSVAKFLSEKSGKKINLKTLTQVSNELKQKETGGSQNTQSKKADGLSNDSNGNTGNAKAGESQKPKRTIPTASNNRSNEDNKAKSQPEKSSDTKPEQVRPPEVRGQQTISEEKKKVHEKFNEQTGLNTQLVGSVSRGEAKENSDIDIVLDGMPHTGKEKLNSKETQENSNYAYDKLRKLAEDGVLTEFELLPNGFGLSFKYKGHLFQVVPNPSAQAKSKVRGQQEVGDGKADEGQQKVNIPEKLEQYKAGKKPVKGDVVFDNKKQLKGVITKVSKPGKTSALANEPFVIDVKYENGITAINLPVGDRFVINSNAVSQDEQIGSNPIRMMGEMVTLVKSVVDEGVSYEIYKGTSSDISFVRVKDEDSGNIVSLKRWSTYALAEKNYNSLLKVVDNFSAQPGELKGVTAIEYEDNGETLLFGTKNKKTRVTVKGLSAEEIKNELDYEREILAKSKKDVANFDEAEIMSAKGMTKEEKEFAIKLNKQTIGNIDQVEKIVIPFYENQLKLKEQSKPTKYPISLSGLDGAKDQLAENTRKFLGQINAYPQNYVGSEEIINPDGKSLGVSFKFYNSDNKTDSKWFVPGDANKMVNAVEKYIQALKINDNEQAKPERSTAAIISSAEAVISEAETASEEKEVDSATDKIEDAINEVESKIGKLTESWSTEDIAHEYPNRVIGKSVKKEITKYAKSIAKQLGWEIPAKNGIYDNIAPAGGDVVFNFIIPGTNWNMYVSAKYEPEYNTSYDNYAFNGFFYRMEAIKPVKGQSNMGGNQWQRENIAAKEMAQILKREADKYLNKPVQPAKTEVATIDAKKLPPNSVIREVRDNSGKSLGFIAIPHDGTIDGIKKVVKESEAGMYDKYPEASGVQSRIGATDQNGDAGYVISPNGRNVAIAGTDEAKYILGDKSKAPSSVIAEYNSVVNGSSISNEDLRKILEKNVDYFTLVKNGSIGVKSVTFGTENGVIFMDTFSKAGDKTVRYYVQPDNQLSIKKTATQIGSEYTVEQTEDGWMVVDNEGMDAIGQYFGTESEAIAAAKDIDTPQIEDKPKKEKTRVTQRLSEKAKKELDDLWDELSDLNNKLGVTVSPEDELKKHKLTLRIVAKATEHGIYKFADIVSLGFEKFGAAFDELLPLIKRAYMAFQADASEDVLDQMDTVADVRSFDYEKFKNIINSEGDYKQESHELIEQNDSIRQFVDIVKNRILGKQKQGIVSLRKLATELGIDVKDTTLQEMVELAVVEASRDVAQGNELNADKLTKIIEIYNNQPTISMRSAERIEKQQYSTPAPTAFLAGLYLNAINPQTVFEPSAGNGILVINFAPGIVTANEIDEVRSENLSKQGFGTVLNQDALQPFNIGKRDGIIMNPPFGSSPEITVNGFKIKGLDEKMIINALNHLATNGRAAIIMGGHNTYDDAGRLAKEKTFFNYLYHHYNVTAVLNMDGQLYQKQGTTFPTRLIFINGVKDTPAGFAPLGDKNNNPVVKSFEELYNIVDNLNTSKNVTQSILQPGLDANQGKSNDVYGESAGTKPTNQGQLSGIPEGQVRPTDTTINSTKGETGSNGGGYVRNTSIYTKSDSQGVGDNNNGIGPIQNLASKDADGSADAANNRGGGDTGIQRNNPIQSVRKFSANELSEKEKVTYRPKSKGNPVGTVIPSQMASEAERILTDIENEFGGIDNFVMDKLNYQNTDELFKALSAEQIDAVAMAIKQIELGQGMIIGDMTGVGKGRIAAAVVRYAVNTGGKPIFLTERPNLFSDLYRDLVAIGSEKLVPFIVNDKSTDSDPTITDEKGNIVHKVLGKPAKKTIFEKKALPPGVDFVMATYSQFRSNPSKPSVKKDFFLSISNDNVLIMDESHNVSGDSNSGQLFQDVLATSKGVTYLSATFAKRPDNMPVYAVRTAMQEANMTKDELVSAIEVGGVALQEVVSSQLVESGQMLRRERTFEGVDIKYEVLNEVGQAHKEIADNVTEIIRDVIDFQAIHVKALIKDLDKEAAGEMAAVGGRKGTSMAGVDNTPFASKVFNVIDQLLFSIKANDVADAVIEELKANRKPVIGFKSTMESFLKNIDVQPGEKLERVDFSLTLKRSLEGTMRYTTTDAMGNKTPGSLSFSDLSPEGQKAYNSILDKITKASLGITISPIDVMIKRITDAGYTVQEITGRSMVLEMQDDGSAIVATRTDKDVKKISRDFNNGNLDVIMINASGATGISLHASSTFKDQRQRVMIDGQLELDINKAVQKRGRIDRTGQVVRGAYRYIVSAIPAEQRLLMMFKSKLKSLDANTTSSQKSKESDVDVTDFLNKYGDEIVTEYLKEDKEINTKLLDPLKFDGKSEEELDKLEKIDGAARKVTGRVAILNSKDQEVFYKEVVQRYLDFMEYLESNNSNDLEVKVLPLNATTVKSQVIVVGKGGTSPFGRDSILESIEADVLKKPLTKSEIDAEVKDGLAGLTPAESSSKLDDAAEAYYEDFIKREQESIANDFESKRKGVEELATKKAIKEGVPVQQAVAEALAALEESGRLKSERITVKYEGVSRSISRMVRYFKAGEIYQVPTSVRTDTVIGSSDGIFLGFHVKEKSKNPYAPSAIKMRFAVNDGRRVVVVPLSKRDFINAIIANSQFFSADTKQKKIDNWDSLQTNRTRESRYIVTGNLLQAYGTNHGQLVSYTDDKGDMKKGLLMPEDYKVGEQKLRVPIGQAAPYLKDSNSSITTIDKEVTITRERSGGFTIEVPLSKQSGGKYFLDLTLRDMINERGFNQMGGRMVAYFNESRLQDILNHLQATHNSSIEIGGQSKPDVKFSAKGAANDFQTNDTTPATLESLKKKYPLASVVQSQNELPKEVRDQAKLNKYTVEGVLYNGKVYLVADNLETMGRAEGVYRHERIGHASVIAHLKDKLDGFARSLVNNATKGQMVRLESMSQVLYKKPVADLTIEQKSILGQEYIAQAAENPAKSPVTWEKIVAFVRQVLRDLGIKLAVSDKDIKILLDRAAKTQNVVPENDTRFSSKEMAENLRKAREQAQAAEESGNQKQDNSISEDLKQYAREFIDYTKKKNPDATADDVIGEMESERGTGFTDEEGVILFDYIRNQFEPVSEAQEEEQPDIPQPETKPLQEADEVVIRKILEQQIDEKQYPAHFSINEKSLREAAKTQSKGQDDREVLDGNYVQAHFVDLKSIALNNARVLQQNLGAKWKNKVVQFLEKNPTAGDVAQVAGILNVISTDIFNEKNEAKRGKKVSELRDLQLRIDAITYNNARSASLALNQRRLYQEFAQGAPIEEILSEIILTPEEMAIKQGVEAALKQKYSDEELNKKTKPPKAKPVTPKPTKPKPDTKSSDIKKDLIEKGNKAKEESDGSGNIKKVTLADKIKQAADALKGFKC